MSTKFQTLHYPLHIQTIQLPNGPLALYVPLPHKVEEIYLVQKQQNVETPFPFWARLWPASIALATYIQHNPGKVTGKFVAELAAGVGLPTLAAAPFARKVWCSDLIDEATNAVALSAVLHGFRNVETASCHWEYIPESLQPDVWLLSDVNYEPAVFNSLLHVILKLLANGATILLATPQRLLAKPFIEKILPYMLEQSFEDVTNNQQLETISIFVLRSIQKPADGYEFS